MRYLNKIVLIESANVKYAEVNIDGNVHFIGTQGVGKSTLLRALLFFYNANQQKLGIPVGKKSFVEFYFPYQNSYIVYEVTRETGTYCVLAFKSQGRVCFRFLDTDYNKSHFIDNQGQIAESWDKIRLALGKEVHYTKKIDRYEDYRNILYGNTQGVGAEFKKYSLLESKQYQNIPRAIQHVFLNYKVESEFIKDTIIKSLDEEEIRIDLSTYSHHLRDFDTQLNDIRKWTEKTKNGEIQVRKQADTVISTYGAIRYIEREKKHLATELLWKVEEITRLQPRIAGKLEQETAKKQQVESRLNDLDQKFQSKKDKLNAQISVLKGNLLKAKSLMTDYESKNIESLLQRVAKKNDIETEFSELTQKKQLLEADFADVKQFYEAQIAQRSNQFLTFKNNKSTEIQQLRESHFQLKESLSREYEKLIGEIKVQYHEELQLARNAVNDILEKIQKLRIRKSEIGHTPFYQAETESCEQTIRRLEEQIRISEHEKTQAHSEIETLKKQWTIDKERMEEKSESEQTSINREIAQLNEKLTAINDIFANSKDSFYGWLNQEYPHWEKSIGQVIDVENVLFNTSLSPRKTNMSECNLYGVEINLEEINRPVKTIADYEDEKTTITKQIESNQKKNITLQEQLQSDLENLKRRYLPKINKNKENIRCNEYTIEQSRNKIEKEIVSLNEWRDKADIDKKTALGAIEMELEGNLAAQDQAQQKVFDVENAIQKRIDAKAKEKDKKILSDFRVMEQSITSVESDIKNKNEETEQGISILKSEQSKQYRKKGADADQIALIDSRITVLKSELDFIAKNNSLVEQYKYNKQEFFDKVELFKSEKTSLENQLDTEAEKFKVQKLKLTDEVRFYDQGIDQINKQLQGIGEDLREFDSFKQTECYISTFNAVEITKESQTEKSCKVLIDEIKSKYYSGIKQTTFLQEAVNKFTGNFSSQNIFSFRINLVEQAEYFQFAEDLREFVEEDKISMYEKRLNERFADIIRQIGKETNELLKKEGAIQNVINNINKDFVARIFTGVIRSIELRVVPSANKIVYLLTEIKRFNDDNIYELGEMNLFSSGEQNRDQKNKVAVELLTQFSREISNYKYNEIKLSDSFELEFKIIENDNDTNWVQNLANVGSDGTDVLVKAMINIMLLNVFKEGATKNRFKDFRLHCMMDEIGKLHPENVRGILKFANDRNIYLINSSPQSFDPLAYKHTYRLAKQTDARDGKAITIINRLITNTR